MRREHSIVEESGGGGGGDDVPFAENLIFYAPMTQGDLTDHISGVTASVATNHGGSCVWDSSMGMYKLEINTSGTTKLYAALRFENCFNFKVNTDWTMTAYVHQTKGLGNNWNPIVCLRDETDTGTAPGRFYICNCVVNGSNGRYGPNGGNSSTNHGDRVIGRITVTVAGSSTRKSFYYLDGVQKYADSLATSKTQTIKHIYLNGVNTNCSNYIFYMKDVRVYNRVLTAAEVAQL